MGSYDLYICFLLIHLVSPKNNPECIFNSTNHTCSVRNDSNYQRKSIPTFERRIFGGKEVTTMTKAPFMASLLRNGSNTITNSPYVASCGATVISPKHLLTAAHCLRHCDLHYKQDVSGNYGWVTCTDHDPKTFEILLGSTVSQNALVKAEAKKISIHPNYIYFDNDNDCILNHDIGVIEITTPLQFTDEISMVSLPTFVDVNTKQTLKLKNNECKVFGYGLIAERNVSIPLPSSLRPLKEAKVHVISISKCIENMKISRPTSHNKDKGLCRFTQFCASSPKNKNGICRGDSGGPIVSDGVQVGVTSWVSTIHCVGPHMPNVFTRVDIHVKWIEDIISGSL